jgi:hypothetical protein
MKNQMGLMHLSVQAAQAIEMERQLVAQEGMEGTLSLACILQLQVLDGKVMGNMA